MCQWLTGRMGLEPFLPVRVPMTIATMVDRTWRRSVHRGPATVNCGGPTVAKYDLKL